MRIQKRDSIRSCFSRSQPCIQAPMMGHFWRAREFAMEGNYKKRWIRLVCYSFMEEPGSVSGLRWHRQINRCGFDKYGFWLRDQVSQLIPEYWIWTQKEIVGILTYSNYPEDTLITDNITIHGSLPETEDGGRFIQVMDQNRRLLFIPLAKCKSFFVSVSGCCYYGVGWRSI